VVSVLTLDLLAATEDYTDDAALRHAAASLLQPAAAGCLRWGAGGGMKSAV
jgi:hypothetical protein